MCLVCKMGCKNWPWVKVEESVSLNFVGFVVWLIKTLSHWYDRGENWGADPISNLPEVTGHSPGLPRDRHRPLNRNQHHPPWGGAFPQRKTFIYLLAPKAFGSFGLRLRWRVGSSLAEGSWKDFLVSLESEGLGPKCFQCLGNHRTDRAL